MKVLSINRCHSSLFTLTASTCISARQYVHTQSISFQSFLSPVTRCSRRRGSYAGSSLYTSLSAISTAAGFSNPRPFEVKQQRIQLATKKYLEANSPNQVLSFPRRVAVSIIRFVVIIHIIEGGALVSRERYYFSEAALAALLEACS